MAVDLIQVTHRIVSRLGENNALSDLDRFDIEQALVMAYRAGLRDGTAETKAELRHFLEI